MTCPVESLAHRDSIRIERVRRRLNVMRWPGDPECAMNAELELQVNRLEREFGSHRARADERWSRLAAEGATLAERVIRLERDLALVSTAVHVLEARVALYAGVGATVGGLLVTLIELYLRMALP